MNQIDQQQFGSETINNSKTYDEINESDQCHIWFKKELKKISVESLQCPNNVSHRKS